jgi:hypothetical protein
MLRRWLVWALVFFGSANVVLWLRARSSASTPPVRLYAGALGRQRPGHRHELLFVVIASSRSRGSKAPGFEEHLAAARRLVARQATVRGAVFASIGVSVDPVLEEGLALLKRYGPFDEVDAGDNWENLGTAAFFWGGLHSEAAIPQVLVVSRDVNDDGRVIVLGTERLLVRKIGSDSLTAWATAGAPVPADSAS